MLWEELFSSEFFDAVKKSNGVCAIPIGCVEARGNHLALGCDTLAIGAVAELAAEKEPVTVFPKMYFGEKSGAGEYPGTIIFPSPLIWQILEHSCYEAARNGFKKIVLVNGHGGNRDNLYAFCRYILQKKPNFLVYTYNDNLPKPREILEDIENYPYLTPEDIAILQGYVDQKMRDGHGGFVESNYLYAVNPKYVREENYGTLSGNSTQLFDEFGEKRLYTPFGWMGNQPNSLDCSIYKNSTGKDFNERIAKAFQQNSVNHLAEAFRFLKNESISDEFHKQWLAKQK